MNKQFKGILIIVAVFVGLLTIGLFLGSAFMFADFFSNPSEKECVKMAEKFLGCKLGKHYQFLDYDADYSHPDRPLSFFVNIPTEDFRAIIDFCYEEAEKKDGIRDTTQRKNLTYIETFSRTHQGFQKEQEVLSGENRVHYQILEVILDLESISFTGMDY